MPAQEFYPNLEVTDHRSSNNRGSVKLANNDLDAEHADFTRAIKPRDA